MLKTDLYSAIKSEDSGKLFFVCLLPKFYIETKITNFKFR